MSAAWWQQATRRPDSEAAAAAQARHACLTKPPGSLGRLEPLVLRLAALQGTPRPHVDTVWITVFAADHGVAAEGVSAFPQAVTGEMLRNFAAGGAAISVLAKALGAQLEVVDLGTVNDPGALASVRRARIAPATANFCSQPAMSLTQLDSALGAGRASVAAAQAAGARLYIGGEMGIGNTTAAAALAAALLRLPPEWLVGAGTGLDAEGIAHKAAVIARALAWHAGEHPPLEWLRRVGGFEIAALCGACIAAAQAGLPVLVDGFIVSVAALAAVRIHPGVRDWLLFSHRSQENGHGAVLDALSADPLLDLGLRLGEGSGAALALPLLRLACALHANMATFAEAGVSEA
ncbi:MAG TPA: nicotinate-nucleotide--dimethylbenzimidazole phosphoribosyltransferase [Stenotrophomonas sp.]|nr:nicotinate-nucleotide--dimethylbenzimidazole phosphoribosyltransferase [Stenotrophomonas sp.]